MDSCFSTAAIAVMHEPYFPGDVLFQNENVMPTNRDSIRCRLCARKFEPVSGEPKRPNWLAKNNYASRAATESAARASGGMSYHFSLSEYRRDQHGDRRERDANHLSLPATEEAEVYGLARQENNP